MPQLAIEYSSNILEKDNIMSLFPECHILLAKMLPTDLNSCKSRAYESKDFCVGDGNLNNAFVHVCLQVMTGRTTDTLNSVGENLMTTLKNYFAQSLKKLNLQISIEIIELEKTYFKNQ